jgi:aryl-alcohol dehydrogenase-like predicted oxidoreductase
LRYKKLGRSGLLVSEVCLGGMLFGEESARGTPPEEAKRMVHRYLDAGGNYIDTADHYGSGLAEEIIGEAVEGRRDEVVLATKVRYSDDPRGPNYEGLSRYRVMRAVEGSLRRLRTDHIDLYTMGRLDPLTPMEETLEAFDDLVASGKVRYVGFTNLEACRVAKAVLTSDAEGWARFVAGQYQYSLVERSIEHEFVPLFLAEGIGLTCWGPLGSGFLSGKYRRGQRAAVAAPGRIADATEEYEEAWERRNTERNWRVIEAVGEIAERHGASYPQVALAWLTGRPAVSSVILGARTGEQLEDNLAATGVDLTPEEFTALDRASTPDEPYPYRMIRRYGVRGYAPRASRPEGGGR